MTALPVLPVSFVEIHSPDIQKSRAFFEEVFGWVMQPFAAPDYLVAPHGDRPGVDTGLLPSRDGQARVVPIIRVDDLADAVARAEAGGATVVVPPFDKGGLGTGCYLTDPSGTLIGLHFYQNQI